jgi:regulator of protease activity HflC (stomatin/prohibitin superfamily)
MTCFVLNEFFVPAGHVGFLMNEKNEYLFAEPGMHNIVDPFLSVVREPAPLLGHIQHGNRTIVIIEQGQIGFAMDNGQPLLLPPGIHVWASDTLHFKKAYPLNDHIIHVGPYTILTVDEGYAAVTQNNGKQMILPGGHTHFLNHMNWKFEKFMSLKVQTDELEKIEATSADNINMSVTSTVNWRIVDPEVAATMAAETMAHTGRRGEVSADLSKLRRDVLKQALASLAGFIGSVNYSGSFHVSAASRQSKPAIDVSTDVPIAEATAVNTNELLDVSAPSAPSSLFMENPLYDTVKMNSAMEHANKTTKTYGILIMSINIISACPVDSNLTKSLASGAVAAAEALQAETAAKGRSQAALIDAKAQANAIKIAAIADAESVRIDAEAKKKAAILNAEGEAESIRLVAEAINNNGEDAVKQRLAEQYINSIMDMNQKAKMMIIPNTSVADIGSMLATATGIADVMKKS